MSKNGENQEPTGQKKVELDYLIPDGLRSTFSNHMTVVHNVDGGDFQLSFFEVVHPAVVGTNEEKKEKLAGLDAIPATCVARIVVTADQVARIIGALAHNYSSYTESKSRQENSSSDKRDEKNAG